MEDTPRPATLRDGQSAHLYLSYASIAQSLVAKGLVGKVKLTPVCVDSVGGEHRGDPWIIDPMEWVNR